MTQNLVITIVSLVALAWLAYLGVSAFRGRAGEEVPPNLAPWASDAELETRRLDRVLGFAVVLAGFLAVSLPIYYLGEIDRQEGFVEEFDETALEHGLEVIHEFGCQDCHGANFEGGVATYVEKRSGVAVSWAAPALNDLFYRYDFDEAFFWLVWGRANSPMPAWGLEGGGPMNDQQINDLLLYIESIQLSQPEVLAQRQAAIDTALRRYESAGGVVAATIAEQEAVIAEIKAASDLFIALEPVALEARTVLDGAGDGVDVDQDGLSDDAESQLTDLISQAVALERSAAGVVATMVDAAILNPEEPETSGVGISDLSVAEANLAALEAQAAALDSQALADFVTEVEDLINLSGTDGDLDGIADEAEDALTELFVEITAVEAAEVAEAQLFRPTLSGIALDPQQPETGPAPDLEVAIEAVAALESRVAGLSISANNTDRLLSQAETGLGYLLTAAEEQRWALDFQAVADATFGGDLETARRAVGLFNGYCARCHTSGYNAGPAFEQEPGSGGFGPALWQGRAAQAFLSEDDMVDFIIKGSEIGVPYGVNGQGNGRMPGFGAVLTEDDIRLIIQYLQGPTQTGLDLEAGGS